MTEFDAEEWLEVAEICCERIDGVDQEALLRTALNRAYYAALLCVKRRIERVHGRGSVSGFRTHAAILGAVQSGGSRFLEILKVLRSLRARREAADYEFRSEPLAWSMVHKQVGRSRALIRQRIKALPDAEFRRLVIPNT
ncbi:MAG: hypothetical protein ACJ8GN_08520 [Longimicrobiaceae bacterium]